MKKFTSLFISGMLAVTGCVCAATASADEVETAKITVMDGNSVTAVYEVPVGEKVECTVKGTSAAKVTGFHTSIFVNQTDAANPVSESDLDILGYAEGYFANGVHYDPGMFASMQVRPVAPAEFTRDELGFLFTSGLPVSGFDAGVDMIKVAYEVKNPGECTIVTVMNDATIDDENGIPSKDKSAITTVTTLNADVYTEDPTEAPTAEPTEAPTAEPTDAPTEAPTKAPTEAPTNATNPTSAPTNATNPTSAPTNATQNSTASNSSNTGKVDTGDTASIALIGAAMLLASAGVVAVAKKKFAK